MSDLDRPGPAWAEVEALYGEVLELPAGAWESYLDQRCAGNPALRNEVAALLGARGEADAWFEDLGERLLGRGGPEPDQADFDLAGMRLGPYRIERLVGRGGMGSVYSAARADGQFEQRVALKLLRLGLRDRDGGRRFLAERRILARLEHPGIARLLDGGVTADGTPWFAMELVNGLPIDEHCDRLRLSRKARLELLLQVCAAVRHAHANLIVHRDIKPSNVLVAVDGQVKLLDFGIARLLEEEESADSRIARPLTPAWASPEQLAGGTVTTATDVYQLGLLFALLLAGPEAVTAAQAARDRGQRPHAVLSRAAGESEGAARRGLRGDLDAIAEHALAPDPAERYSSVEALAEDVRRHLQGFPVEARAAGRLYRLRCLVARRRTEVAAAALAATLLVVLAVVSVLAAASSRRQAAELAVQRDKARETAELMVDLFSAGDAAVGRADGLSARETVDLSLRRLGSRLAEAPATRAALDHVVGRVYAGLGDLDAAGEHLRSALEHHRSAVEEDLAEHAEVLRHLAQVVRRRGDAQAALALVDEALALRRTGAPDEAAMAGLLADGGVTLLDLGRHDEAEAALGAAIERYERLPALPGFAYAQALRSLADVLHRSGRSGEARPLFERGLEVLSRLGAPAFPERVELLRHLGLAADIGGRYEEATGDFEGILELSRRHYPDGHPAEAEALQALGLVRLHEGELAAALTALEEARALWRRLGLDETASAATAHGILGSVLRLLGRHREAATVLEYAEGLQRRLGQPLLAAMLRQEQALLAEAAGRLDEAASLHDEVVAELGRLAPGSPLALRARSQLGLFRCRTGRDPATGRAEIEAALEDLRGMFGPNSPTVAAVAADLAGCGPVTGPAPLERMAAADSR